MRGDDGSTSSVDDGVEVPLAEVVAVVGASAGVVAVVRDDDHVEVLAACGCPPERAEVWATGDDPELPLGEVARTGVPVLQAGAAVAPLDLAGRRGALGLTFDASRPTGEAGLTVLQAAAGWLARTATGAAPPSPHATGPAVPGRGRSDLPEAMVRTLEAMDEAFVSLDRDWRFTYVNARAEAFLARGRQDLLGRVIWDVFPGEAAARYRARYEEVVRSGRAAAFLEHAEATGRWVEVRAHPEADGLTLYLRDVTDRRAAEAERSGLVAAKRHAAERADLLLGIGTALSRALTLEDVAAVVTEQTGRALATLQSGIALLDDAGTGMRFVSLVGLPLRTQQDWTWFSLDIDAPVTEVARTRHPVMLRSRAEFLARYPHLETDAEVIGLHAWAGVPLVAADRVVGTLVLHWDHERELAPEDEGLLVTIAAQCAQAIERARLYERQRDIATVLQHSLLPRELASGGGVGVAARYRPAGVGMEVGGDWFDVVHRDDGRVALVIGDVSGHSIRAAAVMGQLRNVVRSFTMEGHLPGQALDRANRFLSEVEPDEFATCCVAELQAGEGVAVLVSAGHPPPLVVPAAGEPWFLDLEAAPPLGVADQPVAGERTVLLQAGAALVLYTDGLVEPPGGSLDEGMARLRAAAAAAPSSTDPDALADHLLATVLPQGPARDDVALLVARIGVVDRALGASRRLPADPASAAAARRFAAAVLRSWGMEEVDDVVALLVSELVTNGLLHTAGDVDLRLRPLGTRLRVEVTDRTAEREAVMSAGGDEATSGRGLQLVDVLAAEWGVEAHESGKTVWCDVDLHDRGA